MVYIKIFTESGMKIKTIEINNSELTQAGCHQASWNLKDADNDKIANGIYIYKVSVEGYDLDGKKSSTDETGKLAVLR